MGEWLADTLEAVEFMAEKVEQARAAPRIVMQEMHAYALGLADETGALMESLREKGRAERRTSAAAPALAQHARPPQAVRQARTTPPSNTGVTTTKKKSPKGGTDDQNAR